MTTTRSLADISLFSPDETLLSNNLRQTFETVFNLCLCFSLATLGIITNPLIIAVFAKQGVRDSLSVTLVSIALWDLSVCSTAWIYRLYGPIRLVNPGLSYSWDQVLTPTVLYVNVLSTVVSGCLGAYLAIERCVCVLLPFTVKSLFNPERTACVMLTLSIVVFGSLAVIFCAFDIRLIWSPAFQQTIAVFLPSQFYVNHFEIVFIYFNYTLIAWPAMTFVIMITCTIIIVFKLKKSTQFRVQAQIISTNRGQMSRKDVGVARMLTVVLSIYLFAIFPKLFIYALRLADPSFYLFGFHHNIAVTLSYLMHSINLLNSSVNFFVYLKMSSGFRKAFIKLFAGKISSENGDKRSCKNRLKHVMSQRK